METFTKNCFPVGNGQFPKGEMASAPTTHTSGVTWKNDRALGFHVFLSVLCSVSLQPFFREVATCVTVMVGKCSFGKLQS